jgi:mevalonate kinase
MKTFTVSVPGKWILAGEHAVLRGVPALVFPLRSRTLELRYSSSNNKDLILNLQGDHGRELQVLVWGVLDRACELKKIQRSELHGELWLTSSIPVGAGMGASAALCVAVARWLNFLELVEENELFEFARTLENLFHGESSGVDIAVSLSAQGLYYERNGARRVLEPAWHPRWYISYCGQRGITFECVNKVKAMIAENPEMGAVLDERMRRAVEICEEALTRSVPEQGIEELKLGMELAAGVFQDWGLSEGPPGEHMKMLKAHGALAVKPTGSGGGGYILSLWKTPPKEDLLRKLIPC